MRSGCLNCGTTTLEVIKDGVTDGGRSYALLKCRLCGRLTRHFY